MQTDIFISKCLTALGGEEAIKNIFSIYYQIENKVYENDSLLEVNQVDIYRARGGKIRVEKISQEQTTIIILNGLAGIQKSKKLDNSIKVEELNATEIEQIKRSVRLYPRNFLAHADEYQYHFKGLKTTQETPVYELELLVENISYYFDPNTFFCLNLIDKQNNIVISYSDYQKTGDVFAAMTEKSEKGSKVQIDTIKKLNYNLELDDKLFLTQ